MSFIIFPGVITPPLTPGAVPYGTGSTVLMSAQGTAGQVLLSNGASAPTWSSAVPSTSALAGGVAGDLPYQSAPSTTTFRNLVPGAVVYGDATAPNYTAVGTTGQPLLSNGTAAPAFGTLPVSGGGTGLATLTAENVILGDGTNNVKFVAPGSNGNVLQSNGTTWTSASPAGGGFSTLQVFTSSGTFTIPAGKTTLKVTVTGGGGGGGASASGTGSTGGTSSVASGTQTISTISASGGSGGVESNNGVGGSGGSGSGGDINLTGQGGSGGGQEGTNANAPGGGGSSLWGGGAPSNSGFSGSNYGGGGAGGFQSNNGGGGGGAGGTAIKYLTNVTPGNTLAVTIGTGGAGGSASGAIGGSGHAGVVTFEY